MSDTTCSCPGVMRTGCPCDKCHGTGWYAETVIVNGCEDYDEKYCDCKDGVRLKIIESGRCPPIEWKKDVL